MICCNAKALLCIAESAIHKRVFFSPVHLQESYPVRSWKEKAFLMLSPRKFLVSLFLSYNCLLDIVANNSSQKPLVTQVRVFPSAMRLYWPISAELHVFQPILMKLSAKVPFGYFGIPLFSFFKILTVNRNINNESFLTVHNFFLSIFIQNCFWPAESKSVKIFEISLPVPSYKRKTFTIFNVFFTIFYVFYNFFPLRTDDLAFQVMIIVHW
jgi:hypothetical protein